MAKALFAEGKNVAILIADGTYMYIEKSSNYSFQRRPLSMHKGRPLVKPMVVNTIELFWMSLVPILMGKIIMLIY